MIDLGEDLYLQNTFLPDIPQLAALEPVLHSSEPRIQPPLHPPIRVRECSGCELGTRSQIIMHRRTGDR